MPPVRLIDLRHEPPAKGPFRAISPPLERAMSKALDAGGQVMLLLNRRGFSTHVHCPACGHVVMCKYCDLALTYHQQRNVAALPLLRLRSSPAQVCPNCQKSTVRYQGLGTEKLAEEIARRFPGRTLERMDSDTMTQARQPRPGARRVPGRAKSTSCSARR